MNIRGLECTTHAHQIILFNHTCYPVLVLHALYMNIHFLTIVRIEFGYRTTQRSQNIYIMNEDGDGTNIYSA